ncbi:DUF7009 family protein [Lewinella cohaerens]|uniref:DUF7009 family protein n=1 Tax=Lewinella cohaerens TaxID=70995 RepID=UPI0003604A80|nr:hypothetical protein [Lewinella cohaerens]
MKLRILDNSLRLRLSQAEVAQLAVSKEVLATIHFPAGKALHYRISPSKDVKEIELRYDQGGITVVIPATQLEEWANSDIVGISATNNLENEDTVRILVEKDFKCLTTRAHEDESGLFPHPKDGEVAC